MSKIPEQQRNRIEVHYPGAQDIICLDGRWAQVLSGPRDALVLYLDDGSYQQGIEFSDYTLKKLTTTYAEDLLNSGKLTEQEFERIHFVAGDNTRKNIGMVKVYGYYTKKKF